MTCSNPLTSIRRPFGTSTAFHLQGEAEGFCVSSGFSFTSQLQCLMSALLLGVPAAWARPGGRGFLSLLMVSLCAERDRKIKGCASAPCLVLLTPIWIDWLHWVMRDLQLGENGFWPNGSKRGFSWMSNVIRALEQTDFVTDLWVCSLFFASTRVFTNVTTLSFHPWADLMKDQPLLEQRSLFSCKPSSNLCVTVQTLLTSTHPRKRPSKLRARHSGS